MCLISWAACWLGGWWVVLVRQVFEDAYKSRLSCVILDDIERLLEYAPVGPRFSNAVLQTVLVLLKRAPPNGKSKLMVIATTSSLSVLKDLDLGQAFNVAAHVPRLSEPQHLKRGTPSPLTAPSLCPTTLFVFY